MSSADDDYDKLSKEEREVRDKADRAREAAEQAGPKYLFLSFPTRLIALQLCPTLGGKNWEM